MSDLIAGYLSELTDEQLAFSAIYLEDVFAHRRQYLSGFDANQLDTIRQLIKTTPSAIMKFKLMAALDTELQLQISMQFEGEHLLSVFQFHEDHAFLKRLFQALKAPDQQTILQELYKTHKDIYTQLKPLVGHDMSMIGGILVKDEQVVSQFIEKEKLAILSQILSPRHTPKHMDSFSRELNSRYEKHDLHHLCQSLISSFVNKNIPISSLENFSCHLKFYHFLVPYLVIFPELNPNIMPALDLFLTSLNRMPDDEWVLKLLNQLPQTVIQIALERLSGFESVAEFKKRQIYSKLFKSIQANLHQSFADKVKLAYQTL